MHVLVKPFIDLFSYKTPSTTLPYSSSIHLSSSLASSTSQLFLASYLSLNSQHTHKMKLTIKTLLFLALAMAMAMSMITLIGAETEAILDTTTIGSTDIDDTAKSLPSTTTTSSGSSTLPSNTIIRRFMAQKKQPPQRRPPNTPPSVMTCNEFPRVCRAKGSMGPDCCNKKCVNVTNDRLNCGKCGRKCKYSEICCNGYCVNPNYDEKNCGMCQFKCKKGSTCVYGMCNYA